MSTVSACLRAVAVVVLVMSSAAVAQPPQSISDLPSKLELSAQDRQAISAYASYYAGMIGDAESNPGGVREAKRRLVDPLKAPRVGQVFLETYSRELGRALEPVISGGPPHAAANALIILGQLGTEAALEQLLSHVDVRDEPREHIRLVAARSARDLLQSRFLNENLRPISGAARRLRDAADREPSTLVLRRQLEGIIAGDRAGLDDATRRQLYEYVATAMQKAAERAADPQLGAKESAEVMDAVHSVLARVKISLTQLNPALQPAVVEQLVTPTMQLLEVPLRHWEPLREDNGLEAEVARMVGQGELMLQTIVLFSRPRGHAPDGVNLRQTWSSGDREQYEQALAAWRQQLP